MSKPKLSESQEDYLKHIFLLSRHEESVSTNDLSSHLNVKPASVTNMLKKLAKLQLVTHEPYYGVNLTDAGEKVALEIVRHHRLIELYLAEVLGYEWHEVHDEAERLEHIISERFEERIAEQLGHPTHDPHGDPIPSVDLELPKSVDQLPITECNPGEVGVISRVISQDSDFLNMLTRLGLVLKSEIKILENDAKGTRVQIGDQQYLLPTETASFILVEPAKH